MSISNPEGSIQTKKCSRCGETKPITEFWHDKYNTTGYHSICKQCQKTRYVISRKSQPFTQKERFRALLYYRLNKTTINRKKVQKKAILKPSLNAWEQKHLKNYQQAYHKYSIYIKQGIKLKRCDCCHNYKPSTPAYFCEQRLSEDGLFKICITCTNNPKLLDKYWGEKYIDEVEGRES